MYTEEQISEMSAEDRYVLRRELSREDLESVFSFVVGYAPGGIAGALNMIEATNAYMAAQLADARATAALSFGPDDVVAVTPAGIARLDGEDRANEVTVALLPAIAAPCECGHGEGRHPVLSGGRKCFVGGCGCRKFRPRTAVAAPEPPRVVEAEVEPDRVPGPTGLCGHPVSPGAWSQGYHVCLGCADEVSA